jgi:glycosyltransferase involved in cell wall biosynthesis
MGVKRVLFVDHAPIVGGAQLVLATHIEQLDRKRFTPLVACTDAVPALVERYRAAGAEVHTVPMDRLRERSLRVVGRLLRSAVELRRVVVREKVDLVVSNTSRAAYVASLALVGTGVPLVWWVRDFLFGERVFRALRSAPHAIIGVSHAIRSHYGGDGDDRFHVVWVGSDIHRRVDSVTREAIDRERARWGIQPGQVVVGFMGRLVADKGPEDLVAAVERLQPEFPQLRLLLVGTGHGQEGDVEGRLRDDASRRRLRFVSFAGHQSDEALYYRLFDLFVLSTRNAEPFATSVVQAMMAGKPVVATETGGTPELVRHGITGLLVPPASPERLADALATLLRDPALARSMAATARDWVMEHNREEVITAQAEAIYASVLAGRQGKSGRSPR